MGVVHWNYLGHRPRSRWIFTLCIFVVSSWVLFFSPSILVTRFDFLSILPALPPRPLPPPIPAYHRPTFESVGESFVPDPPPVKWEDAKKQVRDAFKFAWDGYLKEAHPFDELRAIHGGGSNKCVCYARLSCKSQWTVTRFNGWGVTLYDSLDTMWIMDLKDEFHHALQLISKQEFLPSTVSLCHITFLSRAPETMVVFVRLGLFSKRLFVISVAFFLPMRYQGNKYS